MSIERFSEIICDSTSISSLQRYKKQFEVINEIKETIENAELVRNEHYCIICHSIFTRRTTRANEIEVCSVCRKEHEKIYEAINNEIGENTIINKIKQLTNLCELTTNGNEKNDTL